jgi:hypothetical protein
MPPAKHAAGPAGPGGEDWMSDDFPTTTEKRCPKCGTESVAWVTTNPPGMVKSPTGRPMTSEQFECRKCNLLFNYLGQG